MRYVIGIIAGVVLIMGAIGGMENDTLNILYSLKMVVIGSILIYGCYMGRKEYRKKGRWVEWLLNMQSFEELNWLDMSMILWNKNGG